MNHENDKRNYSIWVKKYLKEKEFYSFFSRSKKEEIKKYLDDDEETNKFLFNLFQQFLSLYLKCKLSIPSVEIKYIDNNSEFNSSSMIDDVNKMIEEKKINFCYIPELISNGMTLEHSKPYVFTYIDGETYQKKRENL